MTDKAVSKNNILSVKNLTVNFGQHEVLKGINLEIQEGEKFRLLGKMALGNRPLRMRSAILLKPVVKFCIVGNQLLMILFRNVQQKLVILCKIQTL